MPEDRYGRWVFCWWRGRGWDGCGGVCEPTTRCIESVQRSRSARAEINVCQSVIRMAFGLTLFFWRKNQLQCLKTIGSLPHASCGNINPTHLLMPWVLPLVLLPV